MFVTIRSDSMQAGIEAGKKAASLIRAAIALNEKATIVLATGSSQFETLSQLTAEKGIDWSKVTMFHLDEYMGLPVSHPASFRKYLQERFIDKVPELQSVNLINGEDDPEQECRRLESLISQLPVDVALVGIGENGHLAFNDPPADFETDRAYLVVKLDEPCRQQQVNEGWFSSINEVPTHAISMSVKQIMLSKHIVCTVPGIRKAKAVNNSLGRPVSNQYPATILQNHPDCYLFLDTPAASLLQRIKSGV